MVIAEGIETAEELATLIDLGVGCGQGYHLARPAPLVAQSPAERQ
jgi:EAL domain-containing protein (putative c-di-GMP-specific phosphodiesterase class I)